MRPARHLAALAWLAGAFGRPASAATFDPGAVGAACGGDPDCDARVASQLETTLRDDGFTLAPSALGLTPGVARGPGFVFELSAQSLARPVAPVPNLPPALPFLGLGAVLGDSVRLEIAAAGGGLPVEVAGLDAGWTAGGRLGFAVGAPSAGRWIGLDLDGGYATSIRAEVADPADQPVSGRLAHLRAGLDSVMVADIDRTSFLTLRLGGGWERATLDADGGASASWAGIEPRATLGAGYRPHPNGWVTAGLRAGLRDPRPGVPRIPWSGSVSFGWRVGPAERVPEATPEEVAPAAPAAPVMVQVPKVKVVTHPDLACGDQRLGTGEPPPIGTEAWCVEITADGRVVRDGPFVRWHPDGPVAERGQYEQGDRVGTWVTLDVEGRPRSEGRYEADVKVGRWTSWTADGKVESEGDYLGGRENGTWVYYGPDGVSRVVGDWIHGERDGKWLDYGPNGRVTRERLYRDGRLVYSMMK